jgi:hypothetical protein
MAAYADQGLEIVTAGGITFRNARTPPIQGAIMTLGYCDFDVTPDGEHFVMIYPADVAAREGAPTAQIDAVLNWFESSNAAYWRSEFATDLSVSKWPGSGRTTWALERPCYARNGTFVVRI